MYLGFCGSPWFGVMTRVAETSHCTGMDPHRCLLLVCQNIPDIDTYHRIYYNTARELVAAEGDIKMNRWRKPGLAFIITVSLVITISLKPLQPISGE